MARYKHYFPVSHGINHDPEVIEMMDTFGDWSFPLWLEILSITDRAEGEMMGRPDSWASTLARFQRGDLRREADRSRRRWKGTTAAQRVERLLFWMSLKGWLVPVMAGSDGENRHEILNEWSANRPRMLQEWCTNRDKIVKEWSSNHWPNGNKIVGFIVRNYAQYHRTRSAISHENETPNKKNSRAPTIPTLTEKKKSAVPALSKIPLRSVEEEERAAVPGCEGQEKSGQTKGHKSADPPDYAFPAFEAVWDLWPRKEGYGAAKRAWNKLRLPKETVDQILVDIPNWKNYTWKQYTSINFIKKLENWLLEEGYRDRPPKRIIC